MKFYNYADYVNCQITLDAPYHTVPRIADEKVKLQSDLHMIFKYIKENYPDIKIVIQVARGRSTQPTITEVISPVLDELKITLVSVIAW